MSSHFSDSVLFSGIVKRSILPEEVHVVDHNGGGWLMQRSLIDAIGRPRERVDHAGFLFIGDDVLLNLGQLTRAVRTLGCDVIWRSDHNICEDVKKEGGHDRVFGRFLSQAREFSRLSDKKFNDQLARNLGTSSTWVTPRIGLDRRFSSPNDRSHVPQRKSAVVPGCRPSPLHESVLMQVAFVRHENRILGSFVDGLLAWYQIVSSPSEGRHGK